MFILILSMVSALKNNEVNSKDLYAYFPYEAQQFLQLNLSINDEVNVVDYPVGNVLHANISSNICRVQHESIVLSANETKELVAQDLYENDQIIGVIKITGKLGIVTELGIYFEINLTDFSTSKRIKLNTLAQYYNGIYINTSNEVILFFDGIVIILNSELNLKHYIINDIIVNGVVTDGNLIICATNSGLLFFNNGQFNNSIQQLINRKIEDISLENDTLYALTNSGIHIFKIVQNSLMEYEKLPLIQQDFGFAFGQLNQSLVLLIKPQKHIILIDMEINLEEGVWFIVNQHVLKINAKDIDMSDTLAIIQGGDTHNIISHSLSNQFTRIFDYYSFLLPHSLMIGFVDSMLIGVDTDSIVKYNLKQNQAKLICQSEEIFQQQLIYVDVLLSNCSEKSQYNQKIISKDLIACQLNHTLEVNVIIPEEDNNAILIITFILGSFLLLTVLLLVVYRIKTNRQLGKYKEQIKQYEKLQMDHSGMRQPTPHPDNFKIDEDE